MSEKEKQGGEKDILLTINTLGVEFNGKKILSDVTAQVQNGQRLAIIGANGAGKSTLLRVIAGLITPKSGTVSYCGRAIQQIPRREIAQQIAVVSQSETLPPDLRVIDLVLLGRAPYRRGLGLASRTELDLALQTLAELDLKDFGERSLASLSGGELQRVRIARALLQEPKLLLLDESVASLDPGHALYIATLTKKLAEHGVAVISVLHDLNLVLRFADRLWVMQRGRLMLDEPVAQAMQPDKIGPLLDVQLLAGQIGDWQVLIPR